MKPNKKPGISGTAPDKKKQVFTGVNVLGGGAATNTHHNNTSQTYQPVSARKGFMRYEKIVRNMITFGF